MEKDENKRFIYEFGKFVLDPQEKTLLVDGQPLHLPSKEFETLLFLIENNGRALTKEEMITAVWQDAFVEESNLAKQISRLRKIFNDNGDINIETIPKHGYRLTAEVSQIFQPATETLLEKRTVKRLTVRVENEMPDAPLALPPKPANRLPRFVLGALFLIGLAGIISLIWFWREVKQPVKAAENGVRILTDGKFDGAGAIWLDDGRIYFSRYITDKRAETWVMNADGSEQHRANTEIKNLVYGRWSPDGKKVLFYKENEPAIYLANADGSNEIILPFVVGNMDWSPDGSQFVYQSGGNNGKLSEIFLYTLKTGKSVNLTNNDVFDADPSLSPDGKQIAFTSYRENSNAEIYVMNTDGTNPRRLTDHPAFDSYPVFSPDGTQLAFQSNREDERTQIYLVNLNDNAPPRRISNLKGETGIVMKCFSADGTEILVRNNQNGKEQILLTAVEAYPQKLVLSDEKADLSNPHVSPDGKQLLYQATTAADSLELRLTDLETRASKTIFQTEPDYPKGYGLAPSWSPDGQSIVFNAKTSGNSEVFIIKPDGSNLQNLTNDPMQDVNPIFSPDGNEIIFVRSSYGVAKFYRMNTDGTNQRRLTEREGYEMTPAFSPDGASLVFAGDRDGHGLEIFELDLNNPNNEKLLMSRRSHDASPAFSPDGTRIAFLARSEGNNEIYLMNANGTGLFRLTNTKADESAPEFSKDGKKLIFSSKQSEKSAIYEIELP